MLYYQCGKHLDTSDTLENTVCFLISILYPSIINTVNELVLTLKKYLSSLKGVHTLRSKTSACKKY